MVENANDFWNYYKDENVVLTEAQEDPGILTAADFQVENEDKKKKARAVRDARSVDPTFGSPQPVRNKTRAAKVEVINISLGLS